MAVDYRTNPAVLNKWITVYAQMQIRDSFNNARTVWHPFKRVKAALEPLTGREYWTASMSQAEGTMRIVIRYIKGINDQMRFVYHSPDGDKTYEVKSPPINVNENNEFLEIMCRELIEQKG